MSEGDQAEGVGRAGQSFETGVGEDDDVGVGGVAEYGEDAAGRGGKVARSAVVNSFRATCS